jgi:uncharacterized protein
MLLDLSRMREAHDHLDRSFDASAFAAAQEDYRVVAPVQLSVDIDKDGRQFRLAGRVRTRLELPCSRCLEPFSLAVDEPFDLLYLPHGENRGEGEREIEDDDLATAFYRDDVIDLGELMREQFYLAAPMKALCSERCRGLCPVCGTNLNVASCQCQQTWEDPRLAPLRGLVKDKRE